MKSERQHCSAVKAELPLYAGLEPLRDRPRHWRGWRKTRHSLNICPLFAQIVQSSHPDHHGMHRALRIPELLLLTLSQLDLCEFHDPHRDDEQAALAAAATTCTSWKEPALKLLWKEMHDIIPLFKLLGPMKCRVLDAGHDCGTYSEWVGSFDPVDKVEWRANRPSRDLLSKLSPMKLGIAFSTMQLSYKR